MRTEIKHSPNCCGNTPFDRSNPEPPPYLTSLRSRGSRRRFQSNPQMSCYAWYKGPVFSTALRNAQELAVNRRTFLDAGCGNSPDSDLMLGVGFSESIKVDLFPPEYTEYAPDFGKTSFIQGDICKLSDYVPPESVDMIGCSAMLDLMNLADRSLFYCEAYDVMRPGGVLTIYYQWLVHGHHDWNNGYQDLQNANELGFNCLDFTSHSLILRKPEEVNQ